MRLFEAIVLIFPLWLQGAASILSEEDRIVGGREAGRNEFPFVVGLWRRRRNRPFCGGSLITNRWVLTAAHCVNNRRRKIKVVLGDHRPLRRDHGEMHVLPCRTVVHPYYDPSNIINDIALLELCQPVPYTVAIQPIALATEDDQPGRNDSVTVAGWGTTSEGGSVSDVLRAVDLDTMADRTCRRSYGWVSDDQFCAGVRGGGKDSCQGDSGGAIWWKNPKDNVDYQVGIVSSGRGCARPHFPGIYTRMSAYVDWVNSMISSARLD